MTADGRAHGYLHTIMYILRLYCTVPHAHLGLMRACDVNVLVCSTYCTVPHPGIVTIMYRCGGTYSGRVEGRPGTCMMEDARAVGWRRRCCSGAGCAPPGAVPMRPLLCAVRGRSAIEHGRMELSVSIMMHSADIDDIDGDDGWRCWVERDGDGDDTVWRRVSDTGGPQIGSGTLAGS